jgi:hypothetical protein
VLAVAAVLLATLVALISTPYLLVRHLRAHRTPRAKPHESPARARRTRPSTVRVGSPQVKGVA